MKAEDVERDPWVIKQDPKIVQKPATVFGPEVDGSREILGDGDLIVTNVNANKIPENTNNPSAPPNSHSTREAHDNSDFNQINISRAILPGFGVHFAFTFDKYGRRYFSIGPTFGLSLPFSGSVLTGQTLKDGVQVRDKANVGTILEGPSANLHICPVLCTNLGWNLNKFNFFRWPSSAKKDWNRIPRTRSP